MTNRPRNLSGKELARRLDVLGYSFYKQSSGSHARYEPHRNGRHRVTIPTHDPLAVGTLDEILRTVAQHHGMSKEALVELLFGE